jgi:DNA-binding protein HU-beta
MVCRKKFRSLAVEGLEWPARRPYLTATKRFNIINIAESSEDICGGCKRVPASGGQLRGNALIKLDIINEVVNRTGITKTKAEMAVETVFETMKRALTQGDRIELRGFGIFNVRPRKTGIGRNPRTGAEVAIPPGKAVRFRPGKELQSL